MRRPEQFSVSNPGIVNVVLGVAATDDQIRDHMRVMKQLRERNAARYLTCTVNGFAQDARELWEIPEVVGLCKRLVDIGFVSYLEVSTIPINLPEQVRAAFGAAEVWLCSQGKRWPESLPPLEIHRINEDVATMLEAANAVADETCGLFQAPLDPQRN